MLNLTFLCSYYQSSFELNFTVTFVWVLVYLVVLIVGNIDKLYVSIN